MDISEICLFLAEVSLIALLILGALMIFEIVKTVIAAGVLYGLFVAVVVFSILAVALQ